MEQFTLTRLMYFTEDYLLSRSPKREHNVTGRNLNGILFVCLLQYSTFVHISSPDMVAVWWYLWGFEEEPWTRSFPGPNLFRQATGAEFCI